MRASCAIIIAPVPIITRPIAPGSGTARDQEYRADVGTDRERVEAGREVFETVILQRSLCQARRRLVCNIAKRPQTNRHNPPGSGIVTTAQATFVSRLSIKAL